MHKEKSNRIIVLSLSILTAVGLMLVFSPHLLACPNCSEAYAPGSKEAAIGEQYNYSIFFFFGVFTTVLGGGIAFISWKMRQAMRARASKLGIANQ